MDTAADLKNQEILSQATIQAEEIIAHASERAATIKAGFLADRKQAAEVQRVRSTYLTREEVKAAISQVKHDLYDQAFSLAGEELANIRNLITYPEYFKKLLIEAIQESGEVTPLIHIDSRDHVLCSQTLEQLQIQGEIIADITCNGGVLVSSTDGKIVTFNTVESRLKKAKELLKIEIYSQFAGE